MDSLKLDVNKITDLIASKIILGEDSLSVLKLQKLLYYVEAWHVTFFDKKLFDEDFEAWVHGPVCREVFRRFKHERKKFMYSEVSQDDLSIPEAGNIENYSEGSSHIENVLESYGKFSGTQLENLTHREEPWQKARGNLSPSEPCTEIISKESMRDYYKTLLS